MIDFDVVRAETRCIDSNRLVVVRMLEDRAARAGSERTLTGWLRHNFAARDRRNEQEDRIWHRVALVNDNGDEEKRVVPLPFKFIRKIACPGVAVKATHKQDTRHRDFFFSDFFKSQVLVSRDGRS